jgi:hypothetical protein
MTNVFQFPPPGPVPPSPVATTVPSAAGAALRLTELRDTLAGFCLNEARKHYESSHSTPASIATLRELARVAAVVLQIDGPPMAPASDQPIDFARLTPDELESYRRLRDKALSRGVA